MVVCAALSHFDVNIIDNLQVTLIEAVKNYRRVLVKNRVFGA